MPSNVPDSSSDQDAIARLLQLAPRQAEIPVDRERRVRQAVLDECRAVAGRRSSERRAIAAAAVLAIAAAAVLVIRVWPRPEAPPVVDVLATVYRVTGEVGVARSPGGSRALALADTLAAGDEIATDRGGAGLRLAHGGSLRVDRQSRVRLLSAEVLELAVGAVYLDVRRETGRLEIRTPLAVIRDIGTQFEVRLDAGTLRVRVRSGVVEVHRTEVIPATAGTELTISPTAITRRVVAPDGPEWGWAVELAPVFSTDGRPLESFLEHLCREQGWTLSYATPQLAREVSAIVLHGLVEGLTPTDALEVALSASGLGYRLEHGALHVLRLPQR